MKTPGCIYLVVPCYNESAILAGTIGLLLQKLEELTAKNLAAPSSALLLVDDGSGDNTWELISAAHRAEPERVLGLRLSGNRGAQAALFAGMCRAAREADAAITIDADLQDDPDVLNGFLEEFNRGNDIVYGVRSDRGSDSFFKRFTAESYYRLLAWMGVRTVFNHADCRLLSRRALEALAGYTEYNLYLRGIVPLLGFRQAIVLYKRRAADRPTRYPLPKMLLLAWDGITSFSVRPIRLITLLGLLMAFFSMIMLIYYGFVRIFGYTVPGWTSLIFVLLLLGGVQLLSVGIIGEYIGKIYMEVKRRPRFIIDEFLGKEKS